MARTLDCGLAAWVVVLAALVEAEQDAAVDGRSGTDALPTTRELATRGVRLAYGHAALHAGYVRQVLDGLFDRKLVERHEHHHGDMPVFLWSLTPTGRARLRAVVDDVLAPLVLLVPPGTTPTRRRKRR
jgi:hypothetical protein